MKYLLLIFFAMPGCLLAQDRLITLTGPPRTGTLVSVSADAVFFKFYDTAAVKKIDKKEVLLIEDYKGARYLFSDRATGTALKATTGEAEKKNMLGLQPIGILNGRATIVYERLYAEGKVGVVIPLSLTFDPFGSIFRMTDTSANGMQRIKGINFISGIDLNFYPGKPRTARFFIGPRFRYGTDLFLREIQGYSLQTQIGWRFSRPSGFFAQHLAVGYGFARIISSPAGLPVHPKQSYSWISLTYRLSFRW